MSPDWWYTYMRSSPTGFQLTGSPAALNVKPSARGCPLTGSMPEVVVEGVVLLHHQHDVVEGERPGVLAHRQ